MQKTNSRLFTIPDGAQGIKQTLKIMCGLVRKYKTALPVRILAQKLTQRLSQKNYKAEAKTLHEFVRDKIRYVRDVRGVETLQTPIKTLQFGSGDCDDKAILVASLLESIGHPTRFIACGFNNMGFSHVYVESKIGDKWIGVECTEPWALGRVPPNITSKMYRHN